jgi:phytoene dehydrogenase-like protein
VHEEQDQAALELAWSLVHKRLPELGPGIEVIETATPQSYYDVTRRKLGMVGPIVRVLGGSRHSSPHATNLPNVFAIGDTTGPLPGIAGIAESATSLVNSILHFI